MKNACKWTPGPWHCGTFRTYGESPGVDIGAADNSNVALVHHQYLDRNAAETKANARLISKAPEMVELLKRSERVFRTGDQRALEVELLGNMRALLAEIEGEK